MKKFKLKSIFKYVRPVIGRHFGLQVIVFLGLGVGTYLGDIVVPLFYRRLIDTATSLDPSPASLQVILPILFSVGIFLLFQSISYRVAEFSMTRVQSNSMKLLSDKLFKNLTNRSYQFFADNFAGSLVTKMKRFIRSFEVIYDQLAFGLWMLSVSLISILVVVFRENAVLGLAFCAWILIYFAITAIMVKYRIKFDLRAAEEDSTVTARFADVIGNIITLKVFSASHRESLDFATVTRTQEKVRSRAWNASNVQNLVQGLMMMGLEFGGMYLALKLWSEGSLTIGTVVLLQIFMVSIFSKMWGLGRGIRRIIESATNMQEMINIVDAPIKVSDPAKPKPFSVKDGTVSFDGLTFAYADAADVNVFEDFNLEIPAGQKVGLVGFSGSGKTSLTKLLLRFFDIQKGAISIDGQDISQVAQADLRRNISYVPQEPLLFHRSLKENIAYAKPDAAMDDIIAAAKAAKAHEFIEELPNGYDTLVGERGIKLSGGQHQRVAIARVLLEKAPILILDEATSSLDSVSEKLIQEALETAMQGRTALVIAHRLSTIMAMDRIIVLDKGKIVEDGTHQELLDKGGMYSNLWQHQNDGFLADDQAKIDS